jgi:hypothetical protein
LALAKRCLGETLPGPLNFALVHYEDAEPVVRLREFSAWAQSVEWRIPAELARVAGNDGERMTHATTPDPNERLTLPEQIRLLAQVMPEDRAKARIEKAFRSRKIRYQPEFAVEYHDAQVNWQSGVVSLRRLPRRLPSHNWKRERSERPAASISVT